jgi:hypothetical protein
MQHNHEIQWYKCDRDNNEIQAISTAMNKNSQGSQSYRHDIADNRVIIVYRVFKNIMHDQKWWAVTLVNNLSGATWGC